MNKLHFNVLCFVILHILCFSLTVQVSNCHFHRVSIEKEQEEEKSHKSRKHQPDEFNGSFSV